MPFIPIHIATTLLAARHCRDTKPIDRAAPPSQLHAERYAVDSAAGAAAELLSDLPPARYFFSDIRQPAIAIAYAFQ
jgi:hypothetical protein